MNYAHVAIAYLLVGCCAFLSWKRGFGQEKDLLYNSLRAVIQLSVLGYALTWIFAHNTATISLLISLIMTVTATFHVRSRIKSRYPGMLLDNFMVLVLSIWPMTFVGALLLNSKPWWSVEHFLPLIGILLGNSLNGISMGIDHFTNGIREKREEVLEWLALGASNTEATRDIFRRSVRLALTPIMNSMLTMGIVSIPGQMTGQILGGSSPLEAAITQIILVLLIAVVVFAGVAMGLVLARKKLFNHRGQPCF